MSMTMGGSGVALVPLKQKATAASKSYRVVLGWRPAWIWFMKANASAEGTLAFAVDGEFDANSTDAHKGAMQVLTTGTARAGDAKFADLGSDGVTFNDDGFTIGQDAYFKANGAKIWCVCYRSIMSSQEMIDLDDVSTYKDSFGSGGQFKQDAQTREGIEVYEV